MTFENLSQIVLLAMSLALGGFCFVLARRLRKLNDLESGLGGAIAVMSSEVERLERAIRMAQSAATAAGKDLSGQIERAREERGLWELRRQIGDAQHDRVVAVQRRRLRKREVLDA